MQEVKKVKDYLKSKYKVFQIVGSGFTLSLTEDLDKKAKAYFKDVLEAEAKGAIELSPIRVSIHV